MSFTCVCIRFIFCSQNLLLFISIYMYCQYVPFFKRSCPLHVCVYVLLPIHDNKWHIFRQIMLFNVCICFVVISCCQDVASFVSILPRWHIFRQIMLFICLCIYFVVILCCQDVASFVSILPRWHIFRQIMLFICLCIYFVVILCCQDVASFVSILPRWHIFRQIMIFTCVYLFCCHFMLSRCRIFRQHTAKMAHLSAGHVIYVCVYVMFDASQLARLVTPFQEAQNQLYIYM